MKRCGSLNAFVQRLRPWKVHYEQEVLYFTVSIGVVEVGKHDADAEGCL